MTTSPAPTLTPETTPIASLEDNGERFEARKYERKDGAIDVVRYAASGTILEKHTFTWSDEMMLFEATLSRASDDDFELGIAAEHWKSCAPYHQTFQFRRSSPPRKNEPTSEIAKWFDEAKRKEAEHLAEAEKAARESGKESFDLRRLEALLNRGSQARREHDHRVRYYLLCPELLTLADYARRLLDDEPWEDD